MIFTNKKTSRKYHIFSQSKFLSSVLVRSTVRYGSVRFCIFFRGSVRFGGSVKFLVRSNTTLKKCCQDWNLPGSFLGTLGFILGTTKITRAKTTLGFGWIRTIVFYN